MVHRSEFLEHTAVYRMIHRTNVLWEKNDILLSFLQLSQDTYKNLKIIIKRFLKLYFVIKLQNKIRLTCVVNHADIMR